MITNTEEYKKLVDNRRYIEERASELAKALFFKHNNINDKEIDNYYATDIIMDHHTVSVKLTYMGDCTRIANWRIIIPIQILLSSQDINTIIYSPSLDPLDQYGYDQPKNKVTFYNI